MKLKLKFMWAVWKAYDRATAFDATDGKKATNVEYLTLSDRYGVPQVTLFMAAKRSAFKVSLFAANFFGSETWRNAQ